MNFQQFMQAYNDANYSPKRFIDEFESWRNNEPIHSDKFGPVKLVDSEGGSEGDGESCHRVFLLVDHNLHVRFDGWYASYHGSEYEHDPYEVVPKTRSVVFYEKP